MLVARAEDGGEARGKVDRLPRAPMDLYIRLERKVVAIENTTSIPCLTCYLSYDHLGSIRLVTDSAANVVAYHDYLPFGEEIPSGYAGRTSRYGAIDNVSQRFTGQYRDSETGLDYFNARYFGAALGRFTSPDPNNAGAKILFVDGAGTARQATDCNQAAKKVGLPGFTYSAAQRIWNDGRLASVSNGAVIASLPAVKWEGESGSN